MPETLTIASHNVVELVGLRNRVTGAYPTNATVTLELLDENEAALSPAVTGISMAYVALSTGRYTMYRGTIPNTVTLTAGTNYIARILATSATIVRRFDIECTAEAG